LSFPRRYAAVLEGAEGGADLRAMVEAAARMANRN
jgi:hypothetical protein